MAYGHRGEVGTRAPARRGGGMSPSSVRNRWDLLLGTRGHPAAASSAQQGYPVRRGRLATNVSFYLVEEQHRCP
jgi:hypothetical protein